MTRMDFPRLVGGWLWLAAGALMAAAYLANGNEFGMVTWVLVIATVVAGLGALSAGTVRWWSGRLIGALLGLDFAGAVADRFGLLGEAGADGVSWGNWDAFVAETHTLAPWGPPEPLAVAATVVEVGLGVMLVVGCQHRWAGKLAAGLLFIYLVSMLVFEGYDRPMSFAMPFLIAAALIASARGDWTSRTAGSRQS